MTHRRFFSGIVARVAAVLFLLCGTALLPAAEPSPDAKLVAHLAAGEFGPALAIAEQLPDVAARDRWRTDIALAQAKAGAQSAAIATLAQVSDDRYRNTALQQLRERPRGAAGGGPQADFDSLIELITSTVQPNTWKEGGVGEGTIAPFPTGVYVDAGGLLKNRTLPADGHALDTLYREAAQLSANANVAKTSTLRKVSLTRLEREVQLLHAQGKQPTDAMQNLAGITRIKYVLIYPETQEIVLAGPAGDWHADAEGRVVNEKGLPVVQLDDLVVVLRNALIKEPKFGCAITPREANLAKTKAFVVESSKAPLKAGGRKKWVDELRETLGRQDISVYGIDPQTHAAHVLVEADYHMKRVGMGLADGTINVKSYLDTIEIGADGKLPPMDVLRWWFTLNYDAVYTSPDRQAFELRGQGVKVLSENELLTERGERVHTGLSDELNSRFAQSFTKEFALLAAKYPVYAELRNLFDLALVAGVIQNEDLAGQVGWHMTHFGPEGAYQPRLDHAPREVDTIVNYRMINDKHIVAGISGGVRCDPRSMLTKEAIKPDTYGVLSAEHGNSKPEKIAPRNWWWD
ncbi:MAG TPA: DUF1598 domain-containing protein [Pirellulaceae bacterium]|nr:DUF1598 domain-containing protein [Pirellulaceae bacterium]